MDIEKLAQLVCDITASETPLEAADYLVDNTSDEAILIMGRMVDTHSIVVLAILPEAEGTVKEVAVKILTEGSRRDIAIMLAAAFGDFLTWVTTTGEQKQ
jgi:alpha-L-fucosidase